MKIKDETIELHVVDVSYLYPLNIIKPVIENPVTIMKIRLKTVLSVICEKG